MHHHAVLPAFDHGEENVVECVEIHPQSQSAESEKVRAAADIAPAFENDVFKRLDLRLRQLILIGIGGCLFS